jgi:hypothetical protein
LGDVVELLNYAPDDLVSVLVIPAGGGQPVSPTGLCTVGDLVDYVGAKPARVNVWHSPAVFAPVTSGRGTAADVVRVSAVFADLDVKPGGLPSWSAAVDLVEALSAALGTGPTYVTYSGHGLQPVWSVEELDAHDVTRGGVVLRRFGRLVQRFARIHGGAADGVFDLARVLRTPGGVNWKDPADPVPVTAVGCGGSPLSWDELDEALDAYGVTTADNLTDGVVRVPVTEWEWADVTCRHVVDLVERIPTARPGARHPWLVCVAVRLAAARRAGCITELMHSLAVEELDRHLALLCATMSPRRQVNPGEVAEALAWGVAKVQTMTDTQVHRELGDPHGVVLHAWIPAEGVSA